MIQGVNFSNVIRAFRTLATHGNFGSERWGFAPACAQFKPIVIIAEHGMMRSDAVMTQDGPLGSKQTASVGMTVAFKINAARKQKNTDATTFPFSQPQQ